MTPSFCETSRKRLDLWEQMDLLELVILESVIEYTARLSVRPVHPSKERAHPVGKEVLVAGNLPG